MENNIIKMFVSIERQEHAHERASRKRREKTVEDVGEFAARCRHYFSDGFPDQKRKENSPDAKRLRKKTIKSSESFKLTRFSR
jgi:hypothetical protein